VIRLQEKELFILIISSRLEIRELIPYEPGKRIDDVKKEYNLDRVVKLASNENPLGCSEKVKEEIKKHLDNLAIYPDNKSTALRDRLSEEFDIASEEILITSGASEMIDILTKTYINKGDEVIMGDLTFPRYKQTTTMMGGIPIEIPLKDFKFDLRAILDNIRDKTKIIWICNPNNPTGTIIPYKKFVDFLNKVPKGVIVVSDEAYREYVTDEDYQSKTHELIKDYPNLVVLRTFSKIYGLASLRVGYTFANREILGEVNRIRSPFIVSTLAQVAALKAIDDKEFLKRAYDVNVEGKDYLYNEFENLGFDYISSETNHILVDIKRNSREVFDKLQEKGVIIRPQKGNYIRVSIGTMEENRFFIEKLKEIM
jgi:histidinol-phosphate aminotransferase